jgi:tripartite-type tricarboxylate transporter receptor subunit TctC
LAIPEIRTMATSGQRHRAAAILVSACAVAGCIAAAAQAQSYPDRPIRLIIPFSAGGPNDLIGRPLTDKMSESLGQPFVIENRAGANGIIGTTLVAKAAPDGATMLMTTGSFTANPAFDAKITYDALNDFAPITLLAESYGLAMTTRPDFPAKSVAEFVALAKRNPGKYSYGHAGVGNATYVAAELFSKLAGIALLKVPYRGAASFAPDIMSGHVDIGFMSTALATPNANSGVLRALAVSGRERAPSLPDVPTLQELGYPEMDVIGYFGLWFPAGTGRDRVELINREAVKALNAPQVRKVIVDSGLRAVGSTPEEFARYLEKDMAWQKDIIRRIGMQ